MEKIEIEDGDAIEIPVPDPAEEGPPLPTASPEPDPVTTAIRLAVGTASLGLEAFRSSLRAWNREPVSGGVTSTPEVGTVGDAVIGTAARGVRAAATLGARGAELGRLGVRTVGSAGRSIGALVPDFLDEPIDRARERAVERIRRLEALGREELDRSRAVARAALDDGLNAVVGRLADNRELRFVIRTQSTSVAEEAVEGLRGETARIDDRLEGAARRFLRRPPKPPAAEPR